MEPGFIYYTPDLFAELGEPLPEPVNGYREAALHFLGIMYAIDQFLETAVDSRVAVIAVSITLAWPSTRGMTLPEIAKQVGTTPAMIARACARFRQLANLDSAGSRSQNSPPH